MNPGSYRIGSPTRRSGLELVDYAEAKNDCTELKLRNLNGDRDREYLLKWFVVGPALGSTVLTYLYLNGRTADTVGLEYHYNDSTGAHTRTTAAGIFAGVTTAAEIVDCGTGNIFCQPRKNKLWKGREVLHQPSNGYRILYTGAGYWTNTDNLTWLLIKADTAKGIGAGTWYAIYRDPMFGGRRDRD